jgi:hypothetical protein
MFEKCKSKITITPVQFIKVLPPYPIKSTENPLFKKDNAWYCILGLLPISPNTTMHTLFFPDTQ